MEALGRVPGVGMDEMTFRDPFEAPDALYVEKSCCSVCQASVDATVIAALSCKPILALLWHGCPGHRDHQKTKSLVPQRLHT